MNNAKRLTVLNDLQILKDKLSGILQPSFIKAIDSVINELKSEEQKSADSKVFFCNRCKCGFNKERKPFSNANTKVAPWNPNNLCPKCLKETVGGLLK